MHVIMLAHFAQKTTATIGFHICTNQI